MVAMRNASDSAKELSGILQLSYNKARQASITSEILDIVGGVEALRNVQPAHREQPAASPISLS
jgi:F-type H+-transporting ATPase subunit gamma